MANTDLFKLRPYFSTNPTFKNPLLKNPLLSNKKWDFYVGFQNGILEKYGLRL